MKCFKAYDVRGRLPDDLNPDIARRIGRAYAAVIGPRRVAIGHDVRLSSPELSDAVAEGLMDAGVNVVDIGLCGTEMVYFAASHLDVHGGIMVTASHNPPDWNGMKFVREQSKPISGDSGLKDIEERAEKNRFEAAPRRGRRTEVDIYGEYIDHLLTYVDRDALKPLKLVVNAGNGGAGLVIDRLESRLPFEFVKIQHEPDGTFPHGVPNPLLPEHRAATADAVTSSGADFGIAWDGDYDRCFLFDEAGRFIEGYYIVGLLAEAFLLKNPGAKIVHDPRLTWNTIDMVEQGGGVPVMSKTGHAFIKERMRLEDAVYGGEMSAHHYFRDFAYCDSGMIPWLLVAELVSRTGRPLSALVEERMAAFPASGEINRSIDDPPAVLAAVEARYAAQALAVDRTDGLSMEFDRWRFNLRASNTEPLVRLNVEARGDAELMEAKTAELLGLLDAN
ncbi:phosphomannomutase [Thioalkalivibrio sp. XN279]|uniref:phosphomannomutase n=1 Tax=Thioalkalivibrio sp. XN279 TaxID=2714953 RepID=UPI001409D786|nr:phosphomannomutase [Thioalkalivibrio sp. XN279]NHA15434.1 phosphomannomutase [Thioalkalivibrio sp. XN279]